MSDNYSALDRRRALGLFEPPERLVLTLPVFGMFEHDMVRRVGAKVLDDDDGRPPAERFVEDKSADIVASRYDLYGKATVEFPDGWRKIWVHVYDERRRQRLDIGPVGSVRVEWLTRYTVKSINSFRVRVVDRENESDAVILGDPVVGKAHRAAIQILDELYPGWTDPGAYWS